MRKRPNLSAKDRAARAERARQISARRFAHHDDEHYRQKIKDGVWINPQGCWVWQGYRHPKGYGCMSYHAKEWRVHRLAYRLFRGPIPAGLVVCHTCDNRPCCNPLHLFLGTFDTNNKDMAAKGRCKYSARSWPRCKHGHDFTPENTRIDSRGFRQCKECNRIRMRTPEYRKVANERQRRRRAAARLQLSESDGGI